MDRRVEALRGLILVASLLGWAAAADAATYYVRTSGNDGNSGLSPATAWASVDHAADTLVAGDIVYIGAGTYTDRADVQNSGTAASPIRFIADTGGAFTGDAGTVILDDGGDTFDIDGKDHIHVIGLTTHGNGTAYKIKDGVGIRIESCLVDGTQMGFEIDQADVTILDCEIRDISDEGIQIKGASNVLARELVVLRSGKSAVEIDDDDSVFDVARCELAESDEEGLRLKKGRVDLVNCIVRDNGKDGLLVDDDVGVLNVWHSTVVSNGDSGFWIKKGTATVRNSIVASNGGNGFRNQAVLVRSYNDVWANASGDYSGTSAGIGSISTDPLFVGSGDYHLQDTSPAIDAGTDASAITSEDRDQNLRPQAGGWDMGAYETEAPEHFEISHDGAADTCIDEAVTITRHDRNHAVDTGYTGTISLSTSTSHGDWSLVTGSGVLVNSGGGAATYAYAAADNGQVVLAFLDTYGEIVNIDVSDGTASEASYEDPVLVVSGGASQSHRDDFGSVSWSNQDGALLWTTDWLEVDGAGLGPGTGNAFVAGGELVLEDFTNTDLDTAVQRQADLSGVSSASFEFDFRTTTEVDSDDAVFIEVSDDGGASWTVLERITGITGVSSGSRSYDISPYLSVNTRVRFRIDGLNGTGGTACCYGGADEEFRVAYAAIVVPAPMICGPDHYGVSHDGSGITCQAENISITAHEAGHGVLSDWTGTINLSVDTGHGDWSLVTGSGVLVNSGSGIATYSYAASDLGVVVLGLANTFAETVNIGVSDGNAMEAAAEDPDLVFGSSGFSFLADGVASAIGTQLGGKASNLAPGAQVLELEAIRTSDSTGACEAALQGASDIELAFTCEDPPSCGAAQVTVNGSPLAANPSGTPATWSTVSLDFGDASDSTAPIVISYPDVGRIQVHARVVLSPSAEEVLGASNPFVVRPFGFDVSVPGNPGASGPTGPIFGVAGADFTASVRAVLWQAADDTDVDGVADGHADADPTNNADLTDNATAASYGREAAVEAVGLASALLAPAAGTDPGLGGITTIASFVGGSGSTTGAYFDEVGVIEIVASVADGDYLGIGPAETAQMLGRSGRVGRFRPDRFDVSVDTAPVLASGCAAGAGFTYLGQRFGYATLPVARVTARSARGTQTRNYAGTWWKISNTTLANRNYTADPAHPVALDVSGVPPAGGDPTILDLGNGTGTLTFDLGTPPAAGLRFARAGAVVPFDAEIGLSIDVVDGDGVAFPTNPFAPAAFGAPSAGNGMAWSAGQEQRYGRMRLVNAFGPETSALPVPLRAEYWTGAGWALNGDDGCSVVMAGDVPITAASPPGLAAATAPSIANAPLLSGDAGLSFSAPGAGNDGWIDIAVGLSAAGISWLGWDWTGDGAGPNFDEDPTARLTFGIAGGDEPVIFRREVY